MGTTTGRATDLITFSRGSLATVTDSDGLIKWAPHNLLLASEQFDTTSWTKSNATVTANSITAPNGTNTADSLLDTAVNNIHYTAQNITSYALSGRDVVVRIFAKKNTLDYMTLGVSDVSSGTLYAVAVFNLATGALATSGAAGTGYAVVGTPTISSVGDGWYYCSMTCTIGTSASFLRSVSAPNKTGIITGSAGGFESYLGNGSGIYVWGAHLYRSDLGGMQANASAYPYYNPSTVKNLVGFTELLTTGWTNTDTTDSQVAEAAPNGSANSIEVTATAGNGTLLASLSLLASPYTFSIWLKRKTGTGTVEITVDGTTYVTAAVTSDWQRFSTTLTPSAGTKTPGIRLVTSGDAVYAWGAQLSDSASLDAYVPNFGAAPSAAAAHGPRLDYDPVTLAAKGLLVEEARTNLAQYSAQFDNAYWTKTSSGTGSVPVVTANAGAAPDGTMTACRIQFALNGGTTASDASTLAGAVTYTAATYTGSVWLKSNTGSNQTIVLLIENAQIAVLTVTPTWQRFTQIRSCTGLLSNFGLRARGTFTGDTTDLLVWGAQVELGSFATSYIPTAAASVTRNADVASVGVSQFPYSATEGTLVFSGDVLGATSANNTYQWMINGDASNYSRGWVFLGAPTTTRFGVTSGGTDQADITLGSLTPNTVFKTASAMKANDFAAVRNGGTPGTDTSGSMQATATTLFLGCGNNSLQQLNGHIRQITYIPRRLTNAELIARTS
jgi:hypothetical protein